MLLFEDISSVVTLLLVRYQDFMRTCIKSEISLVFHSERQICEKRMHIITHQNPSEKLQNATLQSLCVSLRS